MRRLRRVRVLCALCVLVGLVTSHLPAQVNNKKSPCGQPQKDPETGILLIPYDEPHSPCSYPTQITLWRLVDANGIALGYAVDIWDPCEGGLYHQDFLAPQAQNDVNDFLKAVCNPDTAPDSPDFSPRPLATTAYSMSPRPLALTRFSATGTTPAWQASQNVVSGDFDGDGFVDDAFPSFTGITVELLNSDSSVRKSVSLSLSFHTHDPSNSKMIAADFNGDGKLDLALSNGGSYGSDPGGVVILLGNGDGTFQAPKTIPAGPNPLGLAAGDFNGDKKTDLAAASQYTSQVSVLSGNGDGSFAAPVTHQTGSQGFPTSILALDLNGDGRDDLAIANSGSPSSISVLLNTGQGLGSAELTTLSAPASYLAATDLNHDGVPDLVVPSSDVNAITVLTGLGNGAFQTPAYYVTGNAPGSIAFMPLDDGSTVLATLDSNTDAMWLTEVSPEGVVGAPVMNFVVGGGQDIAAADLNGDGQPDAVIAGGSSDIVVSLSKDGAFSAPAGYSANGASQAVAIGDLNNDQKPDVIAAGGATVSTLLGNGNGTLKPAVSTSVNEVSKGSETIAVADFNRDGKLDAAVAETSDVALLLGNGDGTFRSPALLPVGGLMALSVDTGDFNGDGYPDLAVLAAAPYSGQFFPASLYVFRGKGNGTFQNASVVPLQTYGGDHGGVVIGDWNGDGKTDIAAVSNGYGKNITWVVDVLLGDGAGNFSEPAPPPSTEEDLPNLITAADVNGDSFPDLVIGHCCGQTDVTYLIGAGDGTFSSEQQLLSGASPNAVAVTAFGGQTGFLFADASVGGLVSAGSMVALAVAAPLGPPASPSPAITGIGSAASGVILSVAPESLATLVGSNLSTGAGEPPGGIPATSLLGATVTITDSSGAQETALLTYVSPVQINFLVPAGTAIGTARVTVTNTAGAQGSASVPVVNVAPGIFPLNPSSLAAAFALIVQPDGSYSYANVFQFDSSSQLIALPIDLSSGKVYLELYGTGIRNAKSVAVTVGGQSVTKLFSGPQGGFEGLDQVNIGPLPMSLAGSGHTDIVLTADGKAANTVNVTFK